MLLYIGHHCNCCILFLAGYYAAECTCKNEVNCDGASFTTGNSRLCTAFKRGNAPSGAVVSYTVTCLLCTVYYLVLNVGIVDFHI